MVDEHKRVEDWADEPFRLRLFAKLGGDTSNPVLRERLRRNPERFATLAKVDAVMSAIAIVGLCAFAFVVSSLP